MRKSFSIIKISLVFCLLFIESLKAQQIADRFDYPIGDKGYYNNTIYELPEKITTFGGESKNKLFPCDTSSSNWRCSSCGGDKNCPSNEAYNAQDFGSYYSVTGGYHPGEDWHIKGNDIGSSVFATANGKVI